MKNSLPVKISAEGAPFRAGALGTTGPAGNNTAAEGEKTG